MSARTWRVWFWGFVAAIGLAGGTARIAHATEILVPAYFEPAGSSLADWQRIISAVDANYKITTIINPGNGPTPGNPSLLPSWVQASADTCGTCGGSLGFVYTRYGLRPLDEVKADILAYRSLGYTLKGIFIDEMPSWWQMNQGEGPLTRQGFLGYYSQLYSFIKSLDPNWRVMGNPGIRTDEILMTGGEGFGRAADSLVVLENSADYLLNSYQADAWNKKADYRGKLGYLIHATPTTALLADVLNRINQNGGDILYVTDGVLGTDFDTRYSQLTAYWNQMLALAEICAVPEPSTYALFIMGLTLLGVAARRRQTLRR